MVRLLKSVYEKMLAAAVQGSPEEVCGLLCGDIADKVISDVYLLENTEHSECRFSVNPREHLDAVRDIRKRGMTPVGNFHSHPKGPSEPSDEDKRLAYDRNAVYLILSLENTPVLKAFHIENGIAEEEILVIEEGFSNGAVK